MEKNENDLLLDDGKGEGRTLRNFRSATDIEFFYRFVHENDLRREAKMILERVVKGLTPKKKRKKKLQ